VGVLRPPPPHDSIRSLSLDQYVTVT